MAMARIASNQLGICPWSMRVRPIPKVSIIVEVTTKSVREKAKKIAKMVAIAMFLSMFMDNEVVCQVWSLQDSY